MTAGAAKPLKVFCAACRSALYWYVGDVAHGAPIRSTDFRGLTPGQRGPRRGEPMTCRDCGRPFYMTRTNGALVLLTSSGFVPRPPEGSREPSGIYVPQPVAREVARATEYRDPQERKSP